MSFKAQPLNAVDQGLIVPELSLDHTLDPAADKEASPTPNSKVSPLSNSLLSDILPLR